MNCQTGSGRRQHARFWDMTENCLVRAHQEMDERENSPHGMACLTADGTEMVKKGEKNQGNAPGVHSGGREDCISTRCFVLFLSGISRLSQYSLGWIRFPWASRTCRIRWGAWRSTRFISGPVNVVHLPCLIFQGPDALEEVF